jgi:hypothetical protein
MSSDRIDVIAEIEKRKKQNQLEEKRIFTCLANQARLDSINRIQKHRDNHKSVLTQHAKPKYLEHLESENGMIRELEEILQRAVILHDIMSSATTILTALLEIRTILICSSCF